MRSSPRCTTSNIFRNNLPGKRLVIEADNYNQCYLDAFVKRTPVRFLLDSGAAGVYFSTRQAKQLGIDPRHLSFNHTYDEWGGTVRGATIRLRELRIGGYVLHDVDAAMDAIGGVTDSTPLLGSPVLKLLKFQVRDGSCILTLPEP